MRDDLSRAGDRDVTDPYVDPSKHLGPVVPDTLPKSAPAPASGPAPAAVQISQSGPSSSQQVEEWTKPDLDQILSLHDFEAVARRVMARRGWNYYSSSVISTCVMALTDSDVEGPTMRFRW